MTLLVENMQWVLLVGGLVTFSMIQAVFAPRATLRAYFGETVETPAAILVVRNWGALIAGSGALLVYVAFYPEARTLALVFVGACKLVFMALVLSHGGAFLKKQAGLAVVLDGVMVALFAAYLVAAQGVGA